MSETTEKTYLELSEDAGVAHKFYEVTVEGCDMSIRYGRIGAKGTCSVKSLATPEKALAEAAKKIKAILQLNVCRTMLKRSTRFTYLSVSLVESYLARSCGNTVNLPLS